MPEIYALTDPDGSIRYIGKANDARARLKGHLRDARRRKTPVYSWIRKLADDGHVPGLVILETCAAGQDAEKRLIAEHRAAGAQLLNVAEGGNEPFCPTEVRAANGRRNAAARDKRKWELRRSLGVALKRGWLSDETRAKIAHLGIV